MLPHLALDVCHLHFIPLRLFARLRVRTGLVLLQLFALLPSAPLQCRPFPGLYKLKQSTTTNRSGLRLIGFTPSLFVLLPREIDPVSLADCQVSS